MLVVRGAGVNDMFLEQGHEIDRVHAQVLVVSQDDNDVGPGLFILNWQKIGVGIGSVVLWPSARLPEGLLLALVQGGDQGEEGEDDAGSSQHHYETLIEDRKAR